jgi:hypothetical protein
LIEFLIDLQLCVHACEQREGGAGCGGRDVCRLLQPRERCVRTRLQEKRDGLTHDLVHALKCAQSCFVLFALGQERRVRAERQTFRDEIGQRVRAHFGAVERGDEAQQVGVLSLIVDAAEDVQPGRDQALLDLKQLLVEREHAAVARRAVRRQIMCGVGHSVCVLALGGSGAGSDT